MVATEQGKKVPQNDIKSDNEFTNLGKCEKLRYKPKISYNENQLDEIYGYLSNMQTCHLRIKYEEFGNPNGYKTRLVANVSSKKRLSDYNENFAFVARFILAFAQPV